MVLIGTAGHVDHGKSTLVEALTGINPMHLPQEHRRELTIELGFAHLQHPDGYTIGIVDVPGHEKLVKTMISGASGFQIALWVIDAREGLMPQSLEHLDVLNLLGVPRIIPVITKADLATESEVRETTQSIQPLINAPVEIVDSKSKAGIPRLLERIFEACRSLGSDKSRVEALPYMPIDRCFVLKGVGAVVTGTLVRGQLREGDFVAVSSGSDSYRIRSLHNHNRSVPHITAGHRVGVHLHGLKVEDVQRGDVLVPPDYPYRSRRLNAQIQLLKDAPFAWKPGLRAHFLAASFEMECRLWGLVSSDSHTWVQIHLPREACFHPGQRFILRSTNPLITIGGGTIIDIAPDRSRRVTEAEQDRARYFEISKPAAFEVAALSKKWMYPFARQDVRTPSGLLWDRKLDELAAAKFSDWIERAKDQAVEWPFVSVARALRIKPDYVGRYLACFLETNFKGLLTLTSSTLRYDPRRGDLSDDEQRVGEELLRKVGAAGLQPARLAEYNSGTANEKKTFEKVAGRLLKEGRLVRVDNEFVLERSVWDDFKSKVQRATLESFTASEFGKNFGLSRKYSVPYLEALNRANVLRRQGDRHVVVRLK
jgi:selenocysteine-specific elongation factor